MSSHPNSSRPDGDAIGTPAYRARHISMLWSAQLWHEAIVVSFGAVSIGLLFYAVVKGVAL